MIFTCVVILVIFCIFFFFRSTISQVILNNLAMLSLKKNDEKVANLMILLFQNCETINIQVTIYLIVCLDSFDYISICLWHIVLYDIFVYTLFIELMLQILLYLNRWKMYEHKALIYHFLCLPQASKSPTLHTWSWFSTYMLQTKRNQD